MKYLFFILGFSFSVSAENKISQQKLTTLFTTPEIRSKLNQQRNQGKFKRVDLSKTAHPAINIKMQGIVIRKDKPMVIFANDLNTLTSNSLSKNIMFKAQTTSDTASVLVKINKQRIQLKPGQQWNQANSSIIEQYQLKKLLPGQ